ncbi:hypothetical protein GCM10022631_25450 [Deinococcus rubellus]|uniref:hypothetical protein n=1 Tax=Deinococcus rubellus TaxID=1889240 RepID=UPI0031F02318
MENLKKLSDYANSNKKPMSYVRAFRKAVQAREFRAIMLADKFKLAGTTKKVKPREIEEYAILDTPEFTAWHQEISSTLNAAVKGVPTFSDLQSGKVSIEEAERVTQAILEKQAQRNTMQNERAKTRRSGSIA